MGFNKTNLEDETQVTSNDKNVIFEPKSHTYYYNEQPLLSVTQFIKKYSKTFNPLFPSIAKSKKNVREKIGISDAKQLRKYWRLNGERSSNLGTAAHIFAEMYMLDKKSVIKTGYDRAVIKAIKWLKNHNLEIVSQEEVLYNTDYMLAGSCDLTLRNIKTGEFAIGDWKTTEDMYKNYNKLYEPFNNFTDAAINKYSIQLDIYAILHHYHIPEPNRYVIQLLASGDFNIYHPKSPDKKFQLPFTMDKTKKAISTYIKENKPLNSN